MPERFALYYAPATTDPLWLKAAQWLGRDPAGATPVQALTEGIAAEYRHRISRSARRYGFHATIKAPMLLAAGYGRRELEEELTAFALKRPAVAIGQLVPRFIEGFLALVPAEQGKALTDFAGEVVAHFDRFRAPMTPGDREKRIRGGNYTTHQIDLLDRYGYPHVMDEFQFHMTLTDRLPEGERDAVLAAAATWFGPAIAEPFMLDRLTLFRENEPGAPFDRVADFPLSARVSVDA
jgi:hypothetical protein